MINIRTLKKIKENGGLTLKNGKIVNYKTGYQVATEGVETTDIKQVRSLIKSYGGNVGLWYSNGIWYIDKSHRVSTKKEALAVGCACNQQSVLNWKTMGLVWC